MGFIFASRPSDRLPGTDGPFFCAPPLFFIIQNHRSHISREISQRVLNAATQQRPTLILENKPSMSSSLHIYLGDIAATNPRTTPPAHTAPHPPTDQSIPESADPSAPPTKNVATKIALIRPRASGLSRLIM